MIFPLLIAIFDKTDTRAPHERLTVRYSVVTQNRTPVGGAKIIVVGPTAFAFVPRHQTADDKGHAEFNLLTGDYFFFVESPWAGYSV